LPDALAETRLVDRENLPRNRDRIVRESALARAEKDGTEGFRALQCRGERDADDGRERRPVEERALDDDDGSAEAGFRPAR